MSEPLSPAGYLRGLKVHFEHWPTTAMPIVEEDGKPLDPELDAPWSLLERVELRPAGLDGYDLWLDAQARGWQRAYRALRARQAASRPRPLAMGPGYDGHEYHRRRRARGRRRR